MGMTHVECNGCSTYIPDNEMRTFDQCGIPLDGEIVDATYEEEGYTVGMGPGRSPYSHAHVNGHAQMDTRSVLKENGPVKFRRADVVFSVSYIGKQDTAT